MDKKVEALLESMKEQALKDVKVLIKNQIAIGYDPALEILTIKGKDLLPGEFADSIIDVIAKTAGPIIKDEIVKFLEKLSEDKAALPEPQAQA